MSDRVCAFTVKSATLGGYPLRLGCPAFAEPGSEYCPAHRGGIAQPHRPRPRIKRDLSLDEMPWSDDDKDAFSSHVPSK